MWKILVLLLCLSIANQVLCQSEDGATIPFVPAAEFSVYDTQGMPCIFVKINASITIESPPTKDKAIIEVPRDAKVKGKCGNGKDSQIIIRCPMFGLLMHFRKSRVSDAWFIGEIRVSYNLSDKAFGGKPELYGIPGALNGVRSADAFKLWLTPIKESYSCAIPQDIKILDSKKLGVTITFRRIQIQPFARMTSWQYGEAFNCPEEADGRNKTIIPFVVGSLLAISVLLSVLGYASYRYFKVRKSNTKLRKNAFMKCDQVQMWCGNNKKQDDTTGI